MERWLHHAVNLLVGLTGLVYLVMAWLLTPPDDWAVVNHPWQPHVQHAHVLVAPLLVFAVGLMWRTHVLLRIKLQGGLRADSGALLLLLFVPMVGSGYALQVSAEESWRQGWAWVHVVTGGLWVAGYLVHLLGRQARMRAAGPPDSRPAS